MENLESNQLAAADVTGQTGTVFFNNRFTVGVENKLYQAAVFFHLMAQALGVVAVDLDIAVKGLHLGGAVEGIIAVLGLVGCLQK